MYVCLVQMCIVAEKQQTITNRQPLFDPPSRREIKVFFPMISRTEWLLANAQSSGRIPTNITMIRGCQHQFLPRRAQSSSKTLLVVNQVQPRDTFPALNFWTFPAARHFQPQSFWTLLALKFLDKSSRETIPALRQVQPKVLGQVQP